MPIIVVIISNQIFQSENKYFFGFFYFKNSLQKGDISYT